MKRVLLKISGEAFSGSNNSIDMSAANTVANMIEQLDVGGYELAIVVGGWNIYRGSKLIAAGLTPADSHNMSMLSTVFNAMTLQNVLNNRGVESLVLDALHIEFLQDYTSEKWKKYLNQGKIVILSSGTGCPYFSTDTGAVLRALELDCEAVIKLTKVDGVYDKDPMKYEDALFISEISGNDFIAQNLQVFDQTGIILARDNTLPIFVTKLDDYKSLEKIILGKQAGTKIF